MYQIFRILKLATVARSIALTPRVFVSRDEEEGALDIYTDERRFGTSPNFGKKVTRIELQKSKDDELRFFVNFFTESKALIASVKEEDSETVLIAAEAPIPDYELQFELKKLGVLENEDFYILFNPGAFCAVSLTENGELGLCTPRGAFFKTQPNNTKPVKTDPDDVGVADEGMTDAVRDNGGSSKANRSGALTRLASLTDIVGEHVKEIAVVGSLLFSFLVLALLFVKNRRRRRGNVYRYQGKKYKDFATRRAEKLRTVTFHLKGNGDYESSNSPESPTTETKLLHFQADEPLDMRDSSNDSIEIHAMNLMKKHAKRKRRPIQFESL